jgi:tripartite-type tricarboxylate transporter receptor subunit TctC
MRIMKPIAAPFFARGGWHAFAASTLLAAVAAATSALVAVVPAAAADRDAQAYPIRTVRILVSSLPGGSPDVVARLLADRLRALWGQPVVVENRSGAGGNLGTAEVAAAEPDGYTLLSAQPAPLTTNVLLYRRIGFDPAALEPIVIMSSLPNVLVLRRDFPADDVAGLVAYARANPGRTNYGSQGIGTTTHLTAALFARLTGTELTHVPYRGSAQAVNDLVAGHLDMLFMQIDAVREHYAAGKLKMLAVATAERIATLKEVPTVAEAGRAAGLAALADFRSDTWNALAAPPHTPAPVIAKINTAVNDLLRSPEIAMRLSQFGMHPVGGSPAEMAAFLREEAKRWGEVIRAANISIN